MKNTIADVENSFLVGRTRFQQWLAERDRKFYAPIAKTMMHMLIQAQPPEVLDELEKMTPGVLDQIRGGTTNGSKL